MAGSLPETYKKLVTTTLSSDFRKAVSIVTEKLQKPGEKQVLVKNNYVGINATDINMTAGKYFAETPPPFDIGFEGVGTVVAVGSKVTSVEVGQAVAYFSMGAYSEYTIIPEPSAHVVDGTKPDYLGLLVGGLTAAIGLDKTARVTESETVLITAAAGGTGHIAVQWAKAAGCEVIGLCSSEKKADTLKGLGCDRVINYKTEELDEVLSKEYPKGIDVVWETIGGEVFETLLRHLAIRGRLIIVGGISGYKSGKGVPEAELSNLPGMLLTKGASVHGFFLPLYQECHDTYFNYLKDRVDNKELRVLVDDGKSTTGQEFNGLEGVIKAVEHLHSGANMGKVIARLQ